MAPSVERVDVKLPGKNGVESFLEIRKFKPESKVVMMTGYSVNQLLDEAVDNGAWGVLHKPFNMELMFEMLGKIKPRGILIADDDPAFVNTIILRFAGPFSSANIAIRWASFPCNSTV